MTKPCRFALFLAVGLGLLAPTHLFAQAAIAVNSAPPGGAVTMVAGTTAAVAITGATGSPTDWVALYAAGAADGAYLDWRYLNGTTVPPATGLTDATISFSMPVLPGAYEFRLFANDGFGRLATSGAVAVAASPASLLINGVAPPTAAAASAGTVITVDVNNGPANPGDWVGFYAAGAPDGSYLSWRYLNNSTALPSVGSVTSMLTFQAPSASGSYEFRFFISNGFTRLATSTTLVVSTSAAQLVVNGTAPPGAVTLGAGSTAVVSVSDGPGNTTDWVALAVFGSAPNAYVDWRYLSGTTVAPQSGVSAATLTFAMPTMAGEFEFRFFANNSLDQIAASSRVTVLAPIAAVSVNGVVPPTPLSAAPETAVAVGISGGPGNATDWVALAWAGEPDSSYIAWKYLSDTTSPPVAGLTAATVHFTLPAQFDTYEFRLFANNGFSRLATSTNVVVSTEPPLVSISLTNPFPGTTFNAPSSIAIDAAASISNGTITRVEFFSGAAWIGTATSAPYSTVWNAPPTGSHLLTAVAIDNTNTATTSPDVSIAISATGTGAGTLGPPIAAPRGGVYGETQMVTLTAAAGTTIRYTGDGLQPWEGSTLYTEPILVDGLLTLRARAFQTGWESSAAMTEVYQIDSAPPSISALVFPSPNAAGWNNTEVKISFVCADASGIASCSAPVVLSQEGASQLVTGSAIDNAGNIASRSVTVNLDRTSGTVSLTSPTSDTVTSATSIAVAGIVADEFSGVAEAMCNGIPATITGGNVSCDVPLQPGVNAVVLFVRDAAGNGASAGVNVIRASTSTQLTISPKTYTIALGETRVLTVVDDFGIAPTSPSWTSSDPSVVSMSVEADGAILGEAIGQSTVAVTAGGLSAEATVNVVAALGPGDTRWSIAPKTGFSVRAPILAQPVSDDSPDLFSVEQDDAADERYVVTAVRAVDGAELWRAVAPGTPVFGDVHGGLVVTPLHPENLDPIGLVRMGGPGGPTPWSYYSPGELGQAVQAEDGTIYVEELLPGVNSRGRFIWDEFAVAIDGATGHVIARVPIPRDVVSREASDPSCADRRDETQPIVKPPIVGKDGSGYFQVRNFLQHTMGCGSAPRRVDSTLTLLRLQPNGQSSTETVHEEHFTGSVFTCFWTPFPRQTSPDAFGGVLAVWERRRQGIGCGTTPEQFVTRFDGSGGSTQHSMTYRTQIDLVGDRHAYLRAENSLGISAVDVTTWAPLWSSASEVAVFALDADGVLGNNGSALVQRNATGGVVATTPTTLTHETLPLRGQGLIHGVDSVTDMLSAVVVPQTLEAEYSYQLLKGALPGCTAAKFLGDTPGNHKGLVPRAAPYVYRFVDGDPSLPSNHPDRWKPEQKAAVEEAFNLWNAANADPASGLITRFRAFDAAAGDVTQDITLRKVGLGLRVGGSFSVGEVLPDGRIAGGVMSFTTDTNFVRSPVGYRKVALHEIGHALGLQHPWGIGNSPPATFVIRRGGTVMNTLGFWESASPVQRADDPIGNIPNAPTACDQKGALNASTR